MNGRCKACASRARAGLDGQCPACAYERARNDNQQAEGPEPLTSVDLSRLAIVTYGAAAEAEADGEAAHGKRLRELARKCEALAEVTP